MKKITTGAFAILASAFLLAGCTNSSSDFWPKGMYSELGKMSVGENKPIGSFENTETVVTNVVKETGRVILATNHKVNTAPSVSVYTTLYMKDSGNENVGKISVSVRVYHVLGEFDYYSIDDGANEFIYNVSSEHSLGEYVSHTFEKEQSEITVGTLRTVSEKYAKAAVDWFVPILYARVNEYFI